MPVKFILIIFLSKPGALRGMEHWMVKSLICTKGNLCTKKLLQGRQFCTNFNFCTKGSLLHGLINLSFEIHYYKLLYYRNHLLPAINNILFHNLFFINLFIFFINKFYQKIKCLNVVAVAFDFENWTIFGNFTK